MGLSTSIIDRSLAEDPGLEGFFDMCEKVDNFPYEKLKILLCKPMHLQLSFEVLGLEDFFVTDG